MSNPAYEPDPGCPEGSTDGRRRRGDASRAAILATAVDLASVEGLDQLSIGRIATSASVSKSGIVTLFGNKEQLQVAAVEAARVRFIAAVITPAASAPAGLARVVALVEHWIAYSRDRVFPGGCFFVGAGVDFDAKPGAVHDAVAQALDDWVVYLASELGRARDKADVPALDDPDQLAFEITALFDLANRMSLMRGTDVGYERARVAIMARLRAAGADPDALARHVQVKVGSGDQP